MDLHTARLTLETKPPKRLIEMAAFEAVVMIIIAGLMVMAF